MMTPDVNVVLIDLKNNVREVVNPNEDGSYTIVINSRHSYDTQMKAYAHAMKHISDGDFCKENVQHIEADARKVLIPDNAERIPADKYREQIDRLRKERKRIQRQMKRDEKRVQFLIEHCDMFARAEHYKLYGNDL